jgi:hypothetical protein
MHRLFQARAREQCPERLVNLHHFSKRTCCSRNSRTLSAPINQAQSPTSREAKDFLDFFRFSLSFSHLLWLAFQYRLSADFSQHQTLANSTGQISPLFANPAGGSDAGPVITRLAFPLLPSYWLAQLDQCKAIFGIFAIIFVVNLCVSIAEL